MNCLPKSMKRKTTHEPLKKKISRMVFSAPWNTVVLVPLLLMVSTAPECSEAKVSQGSFRLTGVNTEHTVTKFALSPLGTGILKVELFTDKKTAGYPHPDDLQINLYTEPSFNSDRTWTAVAAAPTCDEKIKLASITKSGLIFEKTDDGEKWIAKIEENFGQEMVARRRPIDLVTSGPNYWYVTISDCSLEKYFHDNESPEVSYTVSIMDKRNPAKHRRSLASHISYDELYLPLIYFFNLCVANTLYLFLFYRTARQYGGEVHVTMPIVATTCALHALSSLCALVHYFYFTKNGYGWYTMDALSGHLEALVDSIIGWILLAIAVGWTLPEDVVVNARSDSGGLSLADSIHQVMCLGSQTGGNPSGYVFLTIWGIHAFLCQWGRTYNDDFDCFHDLEHLPGRVLLFFRLALTVLFLGLSASLRRRCRSESLRSFLKAFTAIGASWFVALPCVALLTSKWFVAHRRHTVMTYISVNLQLFSLASLGWLFFRGRTRASSNSNPTSKPASAYHRVASTHNQETGNLGLTGKAIVRFGKTKIRID